MAQIYKIYMNESQLILADFLPKKLSNIQTIGLQDIDLEKLFQASKQKATKGITYLYIHRDVEKVFKSISQKPEIIKAAGGLVKNGEGEYLFIHRLGKWDLPKGKVENNEKMKETAVREVEEECGIRINYLGPKLQTTYHIYMMRGNFVLKQTNWYEMGVNKSPKLIPQTEEDITEAKWIGKKDFDTVLENTYPLIAQILKSV
ncbi:NUDIX domain-containing protein [Sphingobacterium sp. SGR-19]|nr:NUDIX domain-containing protein [Sphingobacterium sp. SGR-19]